MAVLHGDYFDMDIDTIEHWPGDVTEMCLHARRHAETVLCAKAVLATRTGIRRPHQHQPRRKGDRHRGQGNRHDALLGWPTDRHHRLYERRQ
jgi:hypothetical protein